MGAALKERCDLPSLWQVVVIVQCVPLSLQLSCSVSVQPSSLEWDSSGIPQVGHLLQGRGMGGTVSSVEVGGAVGGATACECTLVQMDLQSNRMLPSANQ